jgi:glutathionyl-hydroquinone reductase
MSSARAFSADGEVHGTDGSFERQQSAFRERPHPDRGPEQHHLYVSWACPWAHRTLMTRVVKGLEERLDISVVAPFRDERGWAFRDEYRDALHGWDFLSQAYPDDFAGRVTVPVLWDKVDGRIVNNESADVVRILDAWGDGPELYPEDLREAIDAVNAWVYADFQNGVYRAGFARSQGAYEHAYTGVFRALDRMEAILDGQPYLAGDRITEADWRVLPTLLRFDAVYHTHFRCNGARLIDYPNLLAYARDLYHQPGIAATLKLDQIKEHYYTTHDELNPKRIVPLGPARLGFDD